MEKKYEQYLKKHEVALKELTRKFDILGYLKLIAFVLLVGAAIHAFYPSLRLNFIFIAAIFFILLVGLFIVHIKIDEEMQYHKGLILISKKYIERVNGKWVDFDDTGNELIDSEHPFSSDLDIVGKKSLFQLLNSSNTWHGRQAFANDLLQSNYNSEEVAERQKAIEELSPQLEFTHDFQYYSSKIKPNISITQLLQELKNNELFIHSKFLRCLLKYCPMVITPFSIGTYLFQFKSAYLLAFTLLVIQSFLWCFGYTKTNRYLKNISSLGYGLDNYSKVFTLLQAQTFNTNKLNSIKNNLVIADHSASAALKELNKIISKISVKNNPLIYFILNIFLLWDYGCAFKLEEWKSKYSQLSESWFASLGEFESLLSFSNFSNVINNTCFPTIVKCSRMVKSSNMGHPLIPNTNRICNDFTITDEIIIISGSNMSGKTTFLRTLGINLILAQNGSSVCAVQMETPLLKVITSMRISDDLNEGVSTFYAELKRIKGILELAKSERNMIFFIDEIFRGTNSVDRLLGAKSVIRKLNSYKAMGILTTHDLELCKLSTIHGILNYNFSESYEHKKILFDYKIKKGESKTTNAKFLMEAVGILENI